MDDIAFIRTISATANKGRQEPDGTRRCLILLAERDALIAREARRRGIHEAFKRICEVARFKNDAEWKKADNAISNMIEGQEELNGKF